MEIRGLFKNISNREKALIAGAMALVVIFLIYQTVFSPLMRARDEFQRERIELENRLSNIKILAEKYIAEKNYYETVVGRLEGKKSLSVLTYLENQSAYAGIRENIEYIRPKGNERSDGITKSSVEMKIDAISVRDLLLFLESVEQNRNGLIISYLRLKPFFKEREKVDAIVGITDVIIE